MAVIVTTKPTLFRPTTIGLRSVKRSDYRSRTRLNSRFNWGPMAGQLDWSVVSDLEEFYVRARYVEYVETRKESEHKAYNGRRDYRRVPNGRRFGRTICKVQCGPDDHIVRIKYANKPVTKQVISRKEVIPTVRLFVSTQYVRHGLNMLIEGYDHPGRYIVKDTARMIIQPVRSKHSVGCNCEDCWWSNDQKEVDEFGVPIV